MLTRRKTLAGALALPLLPLAGHLLLQYQAALRSSNLIYLSPLKSDGSESACKGEVWFLFDEPHIYVVTQSDAWRADAVRKGLDKARAWVGEFGVWTNADGKFREGPELVLQGVLETDPFAHANVLEKMGMKYTEEWGVWGPRFSDGLEDGSRVMLRYHMI